MGGQLLITFKLSFMLLKRLPGKRDVTPGNLTWVLTEFSAYLKAEN